VGDIKEEFVGGNVTSLLSAHKEGPQRAQVEKKAGEIPNTLVSRKLKTGKRGKKGRKSNGRRFHKSVQSEAVEEGDHQLFFLRAARKSVKDWKVPSSTHLGRGQGKDLPTRM